MAMVHELSNLGLVIGFCFLFFTYALWLQFSMSPSPKKGVIDWVCFLYIYYSIIHLFCFTNHLENMKPSNNKYQRIWLALTLCLPI